MSYSTEVLADSPSVYYRLGETSGTTIADSSGNGRNATANATITGGVSLIVSDPASGSITPSWRNAFSQADSTFAIGAVGLVVECWINLTDLALDPAATGYFAATAGVNLIMGTAGGANGWCMGVRRSDGALYWAHQGAGDAFFAGTAITAGTAYHVVVVVDTSVSVLAYINGVFISGIAPPSMIAATGALVLNGNDIGVNTSPHCAFNGLDEVAIYSANLSAVRIAAHYAAAITAGSPARDTHTAIPFTQGAGGGGLRGGPH